MSERPGNVSRTVRRIAVGGVLFLCGLMAGSWLRSRQIPELPVTAPSLNSGTTPQAADVKDHPEGFVSPDGKAWRFTSMKARDAAWRARILETAKTDLPGAMRLFQEMPAETPRRTNDGVLDTKGDLLGELFAAHGPDALAAALATGMALETCGIGLQRAPITDSGPFMDLVAAKVEGEGRKLKSSETNALIRFLGRGDLTDSPAGWTRISGLLDLQALDAESIHTLSNMGRAWDKTGINTGLIAAVLGSLERRWDASRLRREILGSLADVRGKSPEQEAEVNAILGAEPGKRQAADFASTSAVRMAFSQSPAASLTWAASQTDPGERAAALDGAFGYLGGVSRLRPLKAILEDATLTTNQELMTRALATAVGDGNAFGSREIKDTLELRELARSRPDVAEAINRNADLKRLIDGAGTGGP